MLLLISRLFAHKRLKPSKREIIRETASVKPDSVNQGGIMRTGKVEITGVDTSSLTTLTEEEKRELLYKIKLGETLRWLL